MKKNQMAQKEPESKESTENSQKLTADFKYEDLELTVPEMLKAGVHFGHKSSRWNPKMKPYIFGIKNGIHIVDLDKTLAMFQEALEYVEQIVANGGKILFVGTKPQAQDVIRWAGEKTEMPYVSNRWLGGTFTNFNEIKKRIRYLNGQEEKMISGEFNKYTKYEQGKIRKEIEKMNEKMGGIKKMESLPQLIFAVDIKEDGLAVKEARRMKIPVVAMSDTNNDPTLADYAIPANDDALSSLKYVLGIVMKKVKEAKSKAKPMPNNKSKKPEIKNKAHDHEK